MNRLKSIARNLRLLLTSELTEQIGEVEARLNQRADTYEQTIDARVEERIAALRQHSDTRADQYEAALDERTNQHEAALDQRLEQYQTALDQRFEERLGTAETRTDERLSEHRIALDQRFALYETALDQRLEERLGTAETRTDARLRDIETRLDARADEVETRLEERWREAAAQLEARTSAAEARTDQRFAERSRDIDARLDDRLSKLEHHIDERFNQFEARTDDRMERHERKIDAMVRQMSNDIVERTDVMLQIFDQRLDKQRRAMRAERASHTPHAPEQTSAPASESADDDHSGNGATPQQLTLFRKLANVATHAQTRIKQAGETALYNQILTWKKTAHEGLNDFTPDEQETADYILSFLDDPREVDYVKQHLRRFVSTLNRIPPAQRRHDRLLELGSLSHLAPAIKKYCGYTEVHCADFWEADEQVTQATVTQKRVAPGAQPEGHTFELRNFNVERDRFPYPDDYFRVVLCCELIEHLQSDPMHMLWECNRVLTQEGWLLLTTPNIASARAIEGLLVGCAPYLLAQYNTRVTADQHNREYAPYEIGVALAAAGFTVVELETEDVWMRSNPAILDLLKQVQISTELRGDNIFALARKTGAPVERYPKELYID